MEAALAQLEDALSELRSLAASAQNAQALLANIANQQTLLDQKVRDLKQSVILASAPAGVVLTSGEQLMASATDDLTLRTGANLNAFAMRNAQIAAADGISLFAQQQGMRLVAASGDILSQARDGKCVMTSAKDMNLKSNSGTTTIEAKAGITLTSEGAYIKIHGGNIELGCPGDITLKCGNFSWEGPASLPHSECIWPGSIPATYSTRVVLDKRIAQLIDQESTVPYQVIALDGTALAKGFLDQYGRTSRVFHASSDPLTVLVGESGEWSKIAQDADLDSRCDCGAALDLIGEHSELPESDGHTSDAGTPLRPVVAYTVSHALSDFDENHSKFVLRQLLGSDADVQAAISLAKE
jgi:type VI secretion system secreted protein VgrG